MAGSRGMLAAKEPLVVPMLLRLSHFKLNSYVVLVVSKQKGITLVFKTDPLQSVDINSTFDSIAVIQKFIQREIEGQLRQMFREDLPGIIHRLSQQWVKAKVEAPYLAKRAPPPPSRYTFDTRSMSDFPTRAGSMSNVGLQPQLRRQPSFASSGIRRPRSVSGMSVTSTGRRAVPATRPALPSSPPNPIPDTTSTFPDLENFDPTYGLRPEGLPTKSVFRGFSSLFTPNKGLADLAEEISDEDDYGDEVGSFDMVDWDDNAPGVTPPTSVYNVKESVTEYETIPAVGGGTITRPRIYHSQSLAQSPEATSKTVPSYSRSYSNILSPRSGLTTPLLSRRTNSLYNPYFSELAVGKTRLNAGFGSSASVSGAPPYQSTSPRRSTTPDSLESPPSHSSSGLGRSVSTPLSSDPPLHEDDAAIYMRRATSERRPSVSSSLGDFQSGSPPHHLGIDHDDPKIVLRPSLNNSIHQLSTLSHSNHTLSPYTRSLEHFTVRSVPPRGVGPSGLSAAFERQPVKAKRKRTYRLGGKQPKQSPLVVPDPSDPLQQPSSPIPPSEFASDMDLYFSHDDLSTPHSPNIHPTYPRQRQSHPQST